MEGVYISSVLTIGVDLVKSTKSFHMLQIKITIHIVTQKDRNTHESTTITAPDKLNFTEIYVTTPSAKYRTTVFCGSGYSVLPLTY